MTLPGRPPERDLFGPEQRPECCELPHQNLPLCDDDGTVRRGAMHHGTDYPCTSHAHFGGWHLICTSPAHRAAAPESAS